MGAAKPKRVQENVYQRNIPQLRASGRKGAEVTNIIRRKAKLEQAAIDDALAFKKAERADEDFKLRDEANEIEYPPELYD